MDSQRIISILHTVLAPLAKWRAVYATPVHANVMGLFGTCSAVRVSAGLRRESLDRFSSPKA
ncbi:MAG: hypothetical protein AAF797_08800 [Planctomycetota bacterium]